MYEMMRSIRNQSGQGTTEYLLVLVLSVAIILGAIVQLNTAFRSWADNYFGEYLTCLLETGELPALGGTTEGICNSSFKAFSLADGRPALGGAIGEGGGGSGGSNGEDENGEGEGSTGRGGSASADSGSESTSKSIGASSGRRGSRFRVRSSDSGSDSDKASQGDQSGQVSFNTYDQQGNRIVRIPIRETDAIRKRRYADDQKDRERTKARTDKALGGGEREGAPVLIKKTARKVAAEAPDEGFEWSFGNLLRILIIMAILIALLLFLGGQALQVSKSLD